MNNCQHCQTELTNPRAKNCQTCTSILNDANHKGAYGFVMEAIATAKADRLTGTEMHQVMSNALKFGVSRRNEWAAQYRESQKQKAAERSEAARFYQKNGYFPDQLDRIVEDIREEMEADKNFKPYDRGEPEIYG